MRLSQRYKTAAIERSQSGVGISTTARLYARKYYAAWGWADMAKMRNADLNDILGKDFIQAEPKHKFRLRTGDVAEIRKSQSMYYVAAIRNNSYDIIAIQPGYKVSEYSEERLKDEDWGSNIWTPEKGK